MIWPLLAITLILLIAAYLVTCALETARKERRAREHWQAQYGHAVEDY